MYKGKKRNKESSLYAGARAPSSFGPRGNFQTALRARESVKKRAREAKREGSTARWTLDMETARGRVAWRGESREEQESATGNILTPRAHPLMTILRALPPRQPWPDVVLFARVPFPLEPEAPAERVGGRRKNKKGTSAFQFDTPLQRQLAFPYFPSRRAAPFLPLFALITREIPGAVLARFGFVITMNLGSRSSCRRLTP